MNYKYAFFGLLVALVVAWAVSVEVRARQVQTPPTGQSEEWLFIATNVTDAEGQQMTRAQLLDQLITASVQTPEEGAEAP